jgi:hypothetical protein
MDEVAKRPKRRSGLGPARAGLLGGGGLADISGAPESGLSEW